MFFSCFESGLENHYFKNPSLMQGRGLYFKLKIWYEGPASAFAQKYTVMNEFLA